jgi:hypothetical protein
MLSIRPTWANLLMMPPPKPAQQLGGGAGFDLVRDSATAAERIRCQVNWS